MSPTPDPSPVSWFAPAAVVVLLLPVVLGLASYLFVRGGPVGYVGVAVLAVAVLALGRLGVRWTQDRGQRRP